MKRINFLLIVVCALSIIHSNAQDLPSQSKEVKLMGCRFVVRAVADNDIISWKAIEAGIAEIDRIEKLISSWDPKSQTSLINKNAGIKAVQVDEELYDLIARSMKISELTNGAFDISFASMDRIYSFDGNDRSLPSSTVIEQAKAKIDYRKIKLDPILKTVFLTETGMKIGFGGIGKGYAANRAKQVMQSISGVHGGIVNASGDLMIWGNDSPSNDTWNIKISDPKNMDKSLADLDVNNTAVVTSGNYEKYFMNKGVRYAHIIDPMTGLPTTGIKSVTVICNDAEIADALATSIFTLGLQDGLHLANQLREVEALVVTDDDKLHHSDNISINYN